jgi:hypothetical protein
VDSKTLLACGFKMKFDDDYGGAADRVWEVGEEKSLLCLIHRK